MFSHNNIIMAILALGFIISVIVFGFANMLANRYKDDINKKQSYQKTADGSKIAFIVFGVALIVFTLVSAFKTY